MKLWGGRFAESNDARVGDFTRSIEIDPGYAAAHNDRGCTLEKLGRFAEAAKAYRRSLEINANGENYPTSLKQLVDGVSAANDVTGKKYKFLRRIPIDPLTGKAEWGLRAYTDAPTSTAWGGSSVYDIYTKAEGKGLDGTKYKDW